MEELREKFEHLNENYQSVLIYYNLYKQLYSVKIKDFWETAGTNEELRDYYWRILWENTGFSFLNMAIIQTYSIVWDTWKDILSIQNMLNDLIKDKKITGEEKQKFEKYVKYIKWENFGKLRNSLAHSFFNKDKKFLSIDLKEFDENIIWFWKILNEIGLKIYESEWDYEWFKELIFNDYEKLINDLGFCYKIRRYYFNKEINPNNYFIEECRKFCNLQIKN